MKTLKSFLSWFAAIPLQVAVGVALSQPLGSALTKFIKAVLSLFA